MRNTAIVLAIAGLAVGLNAARFWYQSSRITPIPGWLQAGLPEPGDAEMSQMAWLWALIESSQKAADLNKAAALWTAVAVVLGGLASIARAWSA
jgi:hypothetical protein